MSATAELDTGYDVERMTNELNLAKRKLPVEAIRWAQQHRDVAIPELMRMIQSQASAIREGRESEDNGAFFAFYLLTEFRAVEAWPVILDALRLPGEEGPFDLFGDAIHERLPVMIPAMGNEHVDELRALIRDREVNEYVRWASLNGFVGLVAWELRPRAEVLGWLREHFQEAVEADDYPMVSALVMQFCDLWPGEMLLEIRTAFDKNLVDTFLVDWRSVEEDQAKGLDAAIQELIEKRTTINETVSELEHWAAFREPEPQPAPNPQPYFELPKKLDRRDFRAAIQSPDSDFEGGTVDRNKPKFGRNDPCRCGSGKKFKKCCGSLAANSAIKPR